MLDTDIFQQQTYCQLPSSKGPKILSGWGGEGEKLEKDALTWNEAQLLGGSPRNKHLLKAAGRGLAVRGDLSGHRKGLEWPKKKTKNNHHVTAV